MAKRRSWTWMAVAVVGLLVVAVVAMGSPATSGGVCPGSQVYCPGVGCLSGMDKCFPGNKGGASAVFSKETFDTWPGAGFRSTPPNYSKETFAGQCPSMKPCPGGTRTDGPCLMEFPSF